ncbi:16S rRNA (uracil(1498)-N(3))-methyltransferase [Candidatus Halobeggiatoa sp. HSG11]|nr:16S rRNA (uracil(1498)-N(3))-methyltransferase [Candidatus Halobeggiatoa sp. HSG11]
MRRSRLFVESSLSVGQKIILPKETSHYLLNVLRTRIDSSVTLFNGKGGEYIAYLIGVTKKTATLQINEYNNISCESPLKLTLVSAISRPEHMDYTIQKAAELGVQQIVPVITERSPPLHKIDKRKHHWFKIIVSACEQSGRNKLPILHDVVSLSTWLAKKQTGNKLVLAPNGERSLCVSLSMHDIQDSITVLVGAEGGLTEIEMQLAIEAGYLDISLGKRILRTETAATAILSICQIWHGDLC